MGALLAAMLCGSGCLVNPYKDADEDGILAEVDCNDTDGLVGGPDQDGDGANCREVGGKDCNDTDPAVFPASDELCDGKDNNCDEKWLDAAGQEKATDDAFETLVIDAFLNADGDDFGGSYSIKVRSCDLQDGWTITPGDCNDDDEYIHPAADEVCDGIDNDCDKKPDDGLTVDLYPDRDGDGRGNAKVDPIQGCTHDPLYSTYVTNYTDCNDLDDDVYEDAEEVCDGIDNDCDDEVDEGFANKRYLDRDGDGHGAGDAFCSDEPYLVDKAGDCDDLNANSYPGATETCDHQDNNCDGKIDEGLTIAQHKDMDGDGYGADGGDGGDGGDEGDETDEIQACPGDEDLAPNRDDCNDDSIAVNPEIDESCNGIDDNCDGDTDEGTQSTYYADTDGDTFGSLSSITQACNPPTGYVENSADCLDSLDIDPNAAAIHPGADEICDGIDNNCNAQSDEGVTHPYYVDSDEDGYGDATHGTEACDAPDGFVDNDDDCDDDNIGISPEAEEACDGIDNNCSGNSDEVALYAKRYLDKDEDGYGVGSEVMICPSEPGYAPISGDCDDNNAAAYPEAKDMPGSPVDYNCSGPDWLETFAGGFTGDGDLATKGYLSPRSLATDAAGNLYIASITENRIRMLEASSSTLKTFAGTGVQGTFTADDVATLGNLDFSEPLATGVAMHESSSGSTLYFSDRNGLGQIIGGKFAKLDATGLTSPFRILDIFPESTKPVLLVADNSSQTLKAVSWDATQKAIAVSLTDPNGNLYSFGNAIGAKVTSITGIRSVYVIDYADPAFNNKSTVSRIDLAPGGYSGSKTRVAGGGASTPAKGVIATAANLESLSSLFVHLDGNDAPTLYLAYFDKTVYGSYILRVPLSGPSIGKIDQMTQVTSDGWHCQGLTNDRSEEHKDDTGYEVVASCEDGYLHGFKFTTGPATVSFLAGTGMAHSSAGNALLESVLGGPWGVAWNPHGLILAEAQRNRVQELREDALSSSQVTTLATANGTVMGATAIDSGSEIALYVSMPFSNQLLLQSYSYGLKKWGTANSYLHTQGMSPQDVFAWVNEVGKQELLIADNVRHCILRVDGTGKIRTLAGICGQKAEGEPVDGYATEITLQFPTNVVASLNAAGTGLDQIFFVEGARVRTMSFATGYVTTLTGAGTSYALSPSMPAANAKFSGAGGSSDGLVTPALSVEFAVDPHNGSQVLYVASSTGFVAQIRPPEGSITGRLGSDSIINVIAGDPPKETGGTSRKGDIGDGIATDALMGSLRDITFDPETGVLYLADYGADKVRRIVP